jgi:hypothetical protein
MFHFETDLSFVCKGGNDPSNTTINEGFDDVAINRKKYAMKLESFFITATSFDFIIFGCTLSRGNKWCHTIR